MEDLKALTECAECTWDYIDRLRMALAAACKEGTKPERNCMKPSRNCTLCETSFASSAGNTGMPTTGPVTDVGGRRREHGEADKKELAKPRPLGDVRAG